MPSRKKKSSNKRSRHALRTKSKSAAETNLLEAASSLYAGPMTEAATEEKMTCSLDTTTSSAEEVATVIYAGGSVATLEEDDMREPNPEFSTPVAGRALNPHSIEEEKYQLKMQLEKLEQLRVKETRKMTELFADTKLELMKVRQEKDAQKKEFEKLLRSRDVEIEILNRHLKSTTTKMTVMSQKYDKHTNHLLAEINDHKETNNQLVDKLASLQKQLDEKSHQYEILQVNNLQYQKTAETKSTELVNYQQNIKVIISQEVEKAKEIQMLKIQTNLSKINLVTSKFHAHAERKLSNLFLKSKRVNACKALEYTTSVENIVREILGVQEE